MQTAIKIAAVAAVVLASGCGGGSGGDGGDDGNDGPFLNQIGRYAPDPRVFDEGAAEIVAFDAVEQRLFVVNADAGSVDVLDARDPSAPALISTIKLPAGGGSANSVAVSGGIVAVAVEADPKQDPGTVVFYNTVGPFDTPLNSVAVGALPDMVTFTHDGSKVLVANEGEPNDDYDNDPEGSVSIIDLSGGVASASVIQLGFAKYNNFADNLRASGIRIFGPGATVAQDFEPEYIALAPDDSEAYVTLQENNAVAVIDFTTPSPSVSLLFPLGFKDHSLPDNAFDPSNEDGFNLRTAPVMGMYLPDSVASFSVGGEVYFVTANEGDSRDYDGFSEEADVKDLVLDPTVFPNAASLQDDSQLGDLKVTDTLGDADDDGDYDALYAFGGRSFSIWRAGDGTQVFDSGDDFERITGERYGDDFNNDNTENDPDGRSDNKGPEPEALTVGEVDGRTYAFIGAERMGGIFVYDITDPTAPTFIEYVNNRDLAKDPETEDAGDLGPEGFDFVPAADSPTGKALLAVGNEISGTTTVYEIRP